MKQINIGRAETNDIVITDDNTVSREHLQILIDDDALVFITDLNSSNGTFKNGKKIIGNHQILLNKQDIVKIGDTSLPWQDYVADYVKKANKDIQIKEKEVKDAYEKEGPNPEVANKIKSKNYGLISLITAIVSWVICGLPLSIVAIIYGIKGAKHNNTLAIIGLVLGIIAFIFSLIAIGSISRY